MTIIFRSILALLLAAGCCSLASAQNLKPRPGLWEVQTTVKTSSGQMEAAMAQMQQQLARMPPEQRKQMEQMMGGRSLPSADGGQTTKICMTQQDADMDDVQMREGCTQKTTRIDAKTLKVSFQCPARGSEPASSGEGTVSMTSPEAYSGHHQMQTVTRGKPERIDMTQKGRWLAADCGAVKPLRRN
ncbi:MAG: DUF3617 domain-containing protein [Comamonadaceae bacterium]|nr:DUF3617 domain-containing protein [Burkholderiales bacterium]MEB2347754.1 DUF3617 domain-containing protein [Comamonadaceae bacterium]